MIAGTGIYVFSLWQKSVKEADDWISGGGSLFQRMDAATGNERRPTVAINDMPEPAVGVMWMSAEDDDQADQQRELGYWVIYYYY